MPQYERRTAIAQGAQAGTTFTFNVAGAERVFIGAGRAAGVATTVIVSGEGGFSSGTSFALGNFFTLTPPGATISEWGMLPNPNTTPIIPLPDTIRVTIGAANAHVIIHADYPG